jgi:hypothetical protein
MGEPAPAYALLRCPPDRIRCSCSEHDDDEQGGNSYRIGPTSPEIHWSEFRPSQSDCERRKIARPRSCASSVGVAPLTIGGAMSKARYPTADARQTTFALCKERRRRQLPARRAREAPKKSWRVPAIPLRQAGPRLTNTLQAPGRNPLTQTGSAGIPLNSWPSPQRPPHIS